MESVLNVIQHAKSAKKKQLNARNAHLIWNSIQLKILVNSSVNQKHKYLMMVNAKAVMKIA